MPLCDDGGTFRANLRQRIFLIKTGDSSRGALVWSRSLTGLRRPDGLNPEPACGFRGCDRI